MIGRTGDHGADVYLVKPDGSGNLSWSKNYGGIGTDYGYSVCEASSGGYVLLTGYSECFGTNTAGKMYLVKTDAAGVSDCNESNFPTIQNNPSTIQTDCQSIEVNPPSQSINTSSIVKKQLMGQVNVCSVITNLQNVQQKKVG